MLTIYYIFSKNSVVVYNILKKLYNQLMHCDDGKIFIDEDDQCMDCKNYAEDVSCPLLTALGLGVVYIEDSLTVTNCGFFKKFERKLHIVRDNESDNIN